MHLIPQFTESICLNLRRDAFYSSSFYSELAFATTAVTAHFHYFSVVSLREIENLHKLVVVNVGMALDEHQRAHLLIKWNISWRAGMRMIVIVSSLKWEIMGTHTSTCTTLPFWCATYSSHIFLVGVPYLRFISLPMSVPLEGILIGVTIQEAYVYNSCYVRMSSVVAFEICNAFLVNLNVRKLFIGKLSKGYCSL